MSYSLSKLYECVGISKQGVHQKLESLQSEHEIEAQLLMIIQDIREDHPTMGVRSMYYKVQPEDMGRDQFEQFCYKYGFKSKQIKRPWITTDSKGVKRFDNLISELDINRVNQVWASDITYFQVNNRFYYLTFVIDAYTRFIKGYSVSSTLRTVDTTIPALKMALRRIKLEPGLIFHSDGGGQYYCKEFLELTAKHHIRNSMCKEAYQNPIGERINGTIKNNYLKHWSINSYKMLTKKVDRAVQLYNYEKPHKSLQYATPFEKENKTYI